MSSERALEDMIVAASRILSDEWMLIGRQGRTGNGGIIDLLAIAPDGALVLIELKRDRTPREVVAQAIDYACWVEGLEADEIAAIYARFAPSRNLAADFQAYFGQPLDEPRPRDCHRCHAPR
ncbi:endonuclease NucS domain-containing protein [Sphingomonas sp. C3-2]|uniref:endonuclease NucS domain-containing protein n=1 Tax=Sphingomonas sp. C3-2 TaxID=3062169 RepID=UPI00294A9B1B|nr:endonuclease NucS domain-containing protein [Sphingomonas sp. C3-2]WOK37296.1 endonuclease NucS [Sphingomonas sp. C3-2]